MISGVLCISSKIDTPLRPFIARSYVGARVGVVGRTAAGKSSLMLTLLRLITVSGGQVDYFRLFLCFLLLHYTTHQ
jgi:ABC-type polysaccharide/polyol phosphate transport system ATPase subunit